MMIALSLIKGFVLGLSYEDDPETLEGSGASFVCLIELGFLRINISKLIPTEKP